MKNILSWKNLEAIRNNKIINFIKWNTLELWCGKGFIADYLEKMGMKNNYTGLDCDKNLVQLLSKKFPIYNFFYHDLDETVKIEWELFDTVISIAVIEHIYNQKNFFLTATNNLKSGWKLIITTPTNFGNDIVYPLMCKVGFRKWIWALSDHVTIYNRDRLRVVENDFWLKIEHFEFFEFFCNQLVVFKKI